MRDPLALLAVALAAGCSDSTGPQDFELQPGTYTLGLSACAECSDGSEPVFAAIWRDGVVARIDISTVSADAALGRFVLLETSEGDSLLGVLDATSIEFSASDNVYAGSVGLAEGTITILLQPDGCGFELAYPEVDTGPGTCEIR